MFLAPVKVRTETSLSTSTDLYAINVSGPTIRIITRRITIAIVTAITPDIDLLGPFSDNLCGPTLNSSFRLNVMRIIKLLHRNAHAQAKG